MIVPAVFALSTGLLLARSEWTLGAIQLVATLAVVSVAFLHVADLRRLLADANARFDAIFERAGISMWLEDWTAVGKEVAFLRRRGVTDLEGYYAGRPEQLRALRAKVMIKDVNGFAVVESGAPGKDALTGSLDGLLPDTDQTFVQWLVAFGRGDRFFRSEAHVTGPDGSEMDTLFTAALPHDLEGFANIIVTSFDITRYKRQQAKLQAADAELARASRASTVGALSASIAHEVNSPLAAIVANAHAALRWLRRPRPELEDAIEAVDAIVADASRARDVVVRTRAFVGNAPSRAEVLDVIDAARNANLLVERELRADGAVVHLSSEPGCPPVKADAVQVQQVFTNLMLNAAHAMRDRDCAKDITVHVRRDGGNVRVDVTDNGPGIPPDRLERIFDPFHSTKPDGMGMGLAICRNLIDAQGGSIWASSDPGRGAAFHFTLPAHDA